MSKSLSSFILHTSAFLFALAPAAFALDTPALSIDPATTTDDSYRAAPNDLRITLYWENDGNWAKPFDQHDRHYTAGVGMSVAWRAPWVDDLLSKIPSFNNEFAQHSAYAMGIATNLSMYTPNLINDPEPQFGDRPFAGFSYVGIFLQRARRAAPPSLGTAPVSSLADPASYSAFESAELDLGILGPSSLAQNAQELIHHMLGLPQPQGWQNQIHDEPEFLLHYDRRWRSQPIQLLGNIPISTQMMPEFGIRTGSLLNSAHAGFLLRTGYNLPDDFGPGDLKNPADFTWQAPCACHSSFEELIKSTSFYIFARPTGTLVAHNALLQGDNFRHDDRVIVTPTPAIFGIEFGAALRIFKHLELVYATTYQSAEFRHQDGWDSWSSVQLTFSVSW